MDFISRMSRLSLRAGLVVSLLLLFACSDNNNNHNGGFVVTDEDSSSSAGFDHSMVAGEPCITCHNGLNATGKSPFHINSTNNCEACHHSTAVWFPTMTVDHAEVLGSCFSCHNNMIAQGKSVNHINTSDVCEACHQPGPIPWAPVAAAAVDHNEVIGTCASCHNNVLASGQGINHIPTTQDCGVCHLTNSWTPAGAP